MSIRAEITLFAAISSTDVAARELSASPDLPARLSVAPCRLQPVLHGPEDNWQESRRDGKCLSRLCSGSPGLSASCYSLRKTINKQKSQPSLAAF